MTDPHDPTAEQWEQARDIVDSMYSDQPSAQFEDDPFAELAATVRDAIAKVAERLGYPVRLVDNAMLTRDIQFARLLRGDERAWDRLWRTWAYAATDTPGRFDLRFGKASVGTVWLDEVLHDHFTGYTETMAAMVAGLNRQL